MTALVTGGDNGLGRAIALLLMSQDYEVHIISKQDILEEMMHEIGKDSLDAAENLVPCVEGGFDVVINNWGINRLSHIGKEREVGLEPDILLSHNVALPYSIIATLVRRGNKPARVINVSSITHRVAQRCTSIYCASKAALVQLTRVQARELSPKGWQINCFAPGKIEDTDMSRLTDEQVLNLRGWTPEEASRYAEGNVPAGRFMTAMEAATNCVHILGFSKYVNGATIECTGGQ